MPLEEGGWNWSVSGILRGFRALGLFAFSWAFEKHPVKVLGSPVRYSLSATRLVPAGLTVVWCWGTLEAIKTRLLAELPWQVGVAWLILGAFLALALKITISLGATDLASVARDALAQLGAAVGGGGGGYSFSSIQSFGRSTSEPKAQRESDSDLTREQLEIPEGQGRPEPMEEHG